MLKKPPDVPVPTLVADRRRWKLQVKLADAGNGEVTVY
jgi:hypothetical protein